MLRRGEPEVVAHLLVGNVAMQGCHCRLGEGVEDALADQEAREADEDAWGHGRRDVPMHWPRQQAPASYKADLCLS